MKRKPILSLFISLAVVAPLTSVGQEGEMAKFYQFYKVKPQLKLRLDSVYKEIEKRRGEFSRSFRGYKEEKGTLNGFEFNWKPYEMEILTSLKNTRNKILRSLIYYSYFDLGYGSFGLALNRETSKNAINEIPHASPVWAMEPSLTEAVIKYAGGEDSCREFIEKLDVRNSDKNLKEYIRNNLAVDRVLKIGKKLPLLEYKKLYDTLKTESSLSFSGKFLVIDIWATWCKPCIDEFTGLIKAYKSKNSKIDFLSISIDTKAVAAIDMLRKFPDIVWNQGIALSTKGILNTLMISGIPCTILVSPDGTILNYGYEMRGEKLATTLKEKTGN